MYYCDIDSLNEKINFFSRFGDTGKGGVTRLALSPEDLQARAEYCRRCQSLGMKVVTDDLANIYATIPGEENLPAIMAASHADSVSQGGNYDGILGVLAALEVAETIVTKNIPHRHPITIGIWTNEEGARFEPAMMSSGIITGKFDKTNMLLSSDADGVTFKTALEKSGYVGDVSNRIFPENCKAYLEMHIEQGPVLEDEEIDIGVVEGVCGMVNYEFTFAGQADHAGTTPMKYRKDALYAAVKTIEYLHQELDKLDGKLVYTTGKISAYPNIHTIIPETVKFTLDVRHQDPKVVKQAVEIIKSIPGIVEKCNASYSQAWSRDTVTFHKQYVNIVENSAKAYGYTSKLMYSGAGHDAQYLADMVPTAMIFVPSTGGHSHCEKEYTPIKSCWKGTNVLLNTILEIDQQ